MASIISISIPEHMKAWVDEAQKQGLKPSKVFQDAINEMMHNESADLGQILKEERRRRSAAAKLIMEYQTFMNEKGIFKEFVDAKTK